MNTNQGMATRESNNILITQTHVTKHISQMIRACGDLAFVMQMQHSQGDLLLKQGRQTNPWWHQEDDPQEVVLVYPVV